MRRIDYSARWPFTFGTCRRWTASPRHPTRIYNRSCGSAPWLRQLMGSSSAHFGHAPRSPDRVRPPSL